MGCEEESAMQFTTVRIERPEGTVLLGGIAVQIEQATAEDGERLGVQGARPYDVFWIYTTQGVPSVPMRRRDVLVDELNSDPETGHPFSVILGSRPGKFRLCGPRTLQA